MPALATEAKPVTSIVTSPAIGIVKKNGIVPNGQAKPDNTTTKEQARKTNLEPVSTALPAPSKLHDGGAARTVCETCASRKAAARTTTLLSTKETKPASTLSVQLARDTQRQMSAATTVDECRLLFDMFLAKSGIPMEPTNDDLPYPSPAPSVIPPNSATSDTDMESLLVELLLSGDSSTDISSIVESDAGKAGPADSTVLLDEPLKSDTSVSTRTEKDTPGDLAD